MKASARVWSLVLVTTAGLGAALLLRHATSIWRSSSGGAALSLGLIGLWFPAQFARVVPRSWREGLLGCGSGTAMAIATWLAYPPAGRAWPALDRQVGELYAAITAAPGRVTALPLLIAIVLLEECVFRGALMDWLLARQPPARAVVTATAVYTLPQIASGSWVLILLALGCGAIWSTQRVRTGQLAVPFLTHVLWDVLVLVLWPVRQ